MLSRLRTIIANSVIVRIQIAFRALILRSDSYLKAGEYEAEREASRDKKPEKIVMPRITLRYKCHR
jgi:hypothetical protein